MPWSVVRRVADKCHPITMVTCTSVTGTTSYSAGPGSHSPPAEVATAWFAAPVMTVAVITNAATAAPRRAGLDRAIDICGKQVRGDDRMLLVGEGARHAMVKRSEGQGSYGRGLGPGVVILVGRCVKSGDWKGVGLRDHCVGVLRQQVALAHQFVGGLRERAHVCVV